MARCVAAPLAIMIAFFVSTSMVLAEERESEEVTVGLYGWGNPYTDYQKWANSITEIQAGDILVFSYDSSVNNVIQATDGFAFDACSSSPNLGQYSSGFDKLVLPSSGTYYFLCSEHCESDGMKFYITVP